MLQITQRVIAFAPRQSILNLTERLFGLGEKIKPYISQKTLPASRFRLSRDHVGQYSEMENNLFDWVIDQRDRGFCVTQGMIRCEALRMLNGTNFQASNGWFSRFLRRKRLVVRRITTSGRDLPKDAGVQANTFLDQCHEFVRSDFDRDTLLNGDENINFTLILQLGKHMRRKARNELKPSRLANKRRVSRYVSLRPLLGPN
jgi:hypothetical protein